MTQERDVYASFVKQAIKHPGLCYAFVNAARLHQHMEKEFNDRLKELCPLPQALAFPHMKMAAAQYWQRNFFSIFFLTIFDAIGISKRRQQMYGIILHAIRGIVTATDNILDDEAKGSVQLSLQGGRVVPNIMVSLMEMGVLQESIYELAENAKTAKETLKGITHALFALGAEESGDEGGVLTVLDPKQLLDQIHRFRGGELFLLAFIAPEVNEPQLADKIRTAKLCVNYIGLCLQILDDLTDFEEDVTNLHHNMLRSWILHYRPDGVYDSEQLNRLDPEVLKHPEIHFRRATQQVMHLAIEMALKGFDYLKQIGYPADGLSAQELIKTMFRLRGLERFWDTYQQYLDSTDGQTSTGSDINYTDYFLF
jgi:hypothetical protein